MLRIENALTEDDRRRCANVSVDPLMVAEAFREGVRATDLAARMFVNPILVGAINPNDREKALTGLFWRLNFCARSALKLSDLQDVQVLVGTSRTAIELYVDIELLHRNVLGDGVERFHAFTETQRLRSARNVERFFATYPQFDSNPSPWDPQRELIAQRGAAIDTQTGMLWGIRENGAPIQPEHWSGRDLKARAQLLSPEIQLLVHEGYDFRNWLIHSGFAGIGGLDADSFRTLSSEGYQALHECMISAFRALGPEFHIERVVNDYRDLLEQLERVPHWVVLDLQVQALGGTSKFRIVTDG